MVTTDSDFVPGSLRAAIDQANIDNTGGIIAAVSADTFYLMAPLPTITCDYLGIFPSVQVYIDAGFSFTDPGPQITASNTCFGYFVEFINVAPTIFSVTTTTDSGPGSLRQAIIDANFSDSYDNIWFNIPGIAPQTIVPLAALPVIDRPLTIDGTTQPANGYTGSAPKIILDGVTTSFQGLNFDYFYHNHEYDGALYGLNIRHFTDGLDTRRSRTFTLGAVNKRNVISANNFGATFEYDSALNVNYNYIGTTADGDADDGNTNFGLALITDTIGYRQFNNNVISGNASGLVIYTNVPAAPGSNIEIKGNLVGTDCTGSFAIPNKNVGIEAGNNQVIVGGTNAGDANLFSGNCISSPVTGKAALITGDYTQVIGNKFGTNLAGTDTIPNAYGGAIVIGGNYAQIGGPSPAQGNLIAASSVGIYGFAHHALIQNNIIGTDVTGTQNWGNIEGISFFGDSNYVFYNVIQNNQYGVYIALASEHDSILNNTISDNVNEAIYNKAQHNVFSDNSIYNNGFGIKNSGAANNFIPTPVFQYTTPDSVGGSALPGAVIELYSSQSLNNTAQGKDYIATITADNAGNWQYVGVLTTPLTVTATQTDSSGNTSAFSDLWQQVAPDVWPGDCNYDLVADNFDFLYLNLALNDTGSVRAGANTAWVAQPSNDWQGKYASGINHKHADCDGNGIVQLADSIAISNNYGQVHAFKSGISNINGGGNDFYATANKDTVAPGDTVTFTIYVGGTSAVDSLFGIAWSYFFDVALVDTSYILTDYSSSVLGIIHNNLESFRKDFYSSGSIDVALCRTDKTDTTSVNGAIATITMKIKSGISSISTLHLQPEIVRAITTGEIPRVFTPSGDSIVIDPVLLYINESNIKDIGINYDMTNDYLLIDVPQNNKSCRLSIYNISGALIETQIIRGGKNRIELNSIPAGIYLYEVTTSNFTQHGRFFKFNK